LVDFLSCIVLHSRLLCIYAQLLDAAFDAARPEHRVGTTWYAYNMHARSGRPARCRGDRRGVRSGGAGAPTEPTHRCLCSHARGNMPHQRLAGSANQQQQQSQRQRDSAPPVPPPSRQGRARRRRAPPSHGVRVWGRGLAASFGGNRDCMDPPAGPPATSRAAAATAVAGLARSQRQRQHDSAPPVPPPSWRGRARRRRAPPSHGVRRWGRGLAVSFGGNRDCMDPPAGPPPTSLGSGGGSGQQQFWTRQGARCLGWGNRVVQDCV
jgi:hypothetical protein